MRDLETIEEICQLKYRYLRFLDTKCWTELGELFTEDATTSYDDGLYSFTGREQLVEFLRTALGRAEIATMHNCHHPEITLLDEDTARGVWALQDMVVDSEHMYMLQGAAIYTDDYVRRDGRWLISHTGYERTFEMTQNLADLPGVAVRIGHPTGGTDPGTSL